VPGVKFCPDGFMSGNQIHTNLGFEWKKKNSRIEYYIRNYFNLEIYIGDTGIYNRHILPNILYMRNTYVMGTNFYTKNMKNKWILGLFYERRITHVNKFFFIFPGHYGGIEWGYTTNIQWINLALKHQIQLIGYAALQKRLDDVIEVFEPYLISLCIEIPIRIKNW
jgi:hypothetical protein